MFQVVGVPVTINGDLKNQFVEANVGFDTTCKVTLKSSAFFSFTLQVLQPTFFHFAHRSFQVNNILTRYLD